MEADVEEVAVGAACAAAEGFLLRRAPLAPRRGRRRDLLPGRARAADKLRDRLSLDLPSLDLRQADRLVRKRAPGPAARVTSPAPDRGQLAALERPIVLSRDAQRPGS